MVKSTEGYPQVVSNERDFPKDPSPRSAAFAIPSLGPINEKNG